MGQNQDLEACEAEGRFQEDEENGQLFKVEVCGCCLSECSVASKINRAFSITVQISGLESWRIHFSDWDGDSTKEVRWKVWLKIVACHYEEHGFGQKWKDKLQLVHSYDAWRRVLSAKRLFRLHIQLFWCWPEWQDKS